MGELSEDIDVCFDQGQVEERDKNIVVEHI